MKPMATVFAKNRRCRPLNRIRIRPSGSRPVENECPEPRDTWVPGSPVARVHPGPGNTGVPDIFGEPNIPARPGYSMVRSSASRPEIGFQAEFRPDSNRESLKIGPPAG